MAKKGFIKTFVITLLAVLIIGLFVSPLFQRNSRDMEVYIPVARNVEGLNFATQERLNEHFNKHASEFGYRNPDEYLQGARKLISAGQEVLTHSRSDGDKLFYDPGKNEFAVLSARGYIRTYFKPNSGYQYWQRQIGTR